jgi:small-conductance mechanosensitive channel
MIAYVTVHFHYRANLGKLSHSKNMHNALVQLYEASIYLYPVSGGQFEEEDLLIRNASGSALGDESIRVSSRLSKAGLDTYSASHLFGNLMMVDPKSHWFKATSSYAVVERALSNPKSAAALARRIWLSLVEFGNESFKAEDVAEVLGPYRRDEALAIFKVLDENESGDIRLDEMEMTVVEAGRIRQAIFQNIHDVDHCINTFDWIALLLLAAVMIFFILVLYVPTIKQIQQTAAFLVIGLSFAVGRVFNHYLSGCVFVFFDHPFDVGDRVEVYNMASSNSVSLIVVRQSLLYTIFRRVDNGTEMQIANERLAQKRIENVTRSGANKQALSITVDFRTTFKDLSFLRTELEAFLTHPDNRRDYLPGLGLSIVAVHDLSKMELRCAFTHKGNWSNEQLRAARSMRFMCALIAAVRKVPLAKPGGLSPSLGDEGKPAYTVMITDVEARKKVDEVAAKAKAKRWDAEDDIQPNMTPAPETVDVSGYQEISKEDAEKAAKEKAAKEAEKAAKAAKEQAAKDAEAAAMTRLMKIPVVAPATTPTTTSGGTSSGVDVPQPGVTRTTTGLRAKSAPGSGSMFHR